MTPTTEMVDRIRSLIADFDDLLGDMERLDESLAASAKPVVSALPTEAEIHGAAAKWVGFEALANLQSSWTRAVRGIYELVASRVVVQKPAEPTRDALAAVIVHETRLTVRDSQSLADEILSAFPGLRLDALIQVKSEPAVSALPTAQECYAAYAKCLGALPWTYCASTTQAAFEQVAALIASRVVVQKPDEPIREALAAVIRHTLDAKGMACIDLTAADAILAAYPGLRLRRMPTREEWARWTLVNISTGWGKNESDYDALKPEYKELFLTRADAILAKLSDLAEPVEINEEELAMALYDDAVPNHLGKTPNEHDRQQARAAIAYFRERANVATKPTPPDAPIVESKIAESAKPPGTSDATWIKAHELEDVWTEAKGNSLASWEAVARHVEAEVRKAKRRALVEACSAVCQLCAAAITSGANPDEGFDFQDTNCKANGIRKLIAALDAETKTETPK